MANALLDLDPSSSTIIPAEPPVDSTPPWVAQPAQNSQQLDNNNPPWQNPEMCQNTDLEAGATGTLPPLHRDTAPLSPQDLQVIAKCLQFAQSRTGAEGPGDLSDRVTLPDGTVAPGEVRVGFAFYARPTVPMTRSTSTVTPVPAPDQTPSLDMPETAALPEIPSEDDDDDASARRAYYPDYESILPAPLDSSPRSTFATRAWEGLNDALRLTLQDSRSRIVLCFLVSLLQAEMSLFYAKQIAEIVRTVDHSSQVPTP